MASSISFRDSGVRVVPRFQPLRLSPGAFRMAVIRIEIDPSAQIPSATQRRTAVDAIADTVRMVRPDAVQIDCDARASERSFYAALLGELRARLGRDVFLSITALVSWCGEHSWLDRLPVDEVVPMAFEMGAATVTTETLLRSGGQFGNPVCRGSIGISMRETGRLPRNYRRIYVFPYEEWTGLLSRSVLARLFP